MRRVIACGRGLAPPSAQLNVRAMAMVEGKGRKQRSKAKADSAVEGLARLLVRLQAARLARLARARHQAAVAAALHAVGGRLRAGSRRAGGRGRRRRLHEVGRWRGRSEAEEGSEGFALRLVGRLRRQG